MSRQRGAIDTLDTDQPWWSGVQEAGRIDAPYLSVRPHNFRPPGGADKLLYQTYGALRSSWPTYAAVAGGHRDYEHLMQGHPGHVGGVPFMPAGVALAWGVVTRNGTEWWPLEVEGIDDSPTWDTVSLSPPALDGEWWQRTQGKGRDIVIKGRVIAPTREAAQFARRHVSAALAVEPQTGWLYREDEDGTVWRIPVAPTQAHKVEFVGDRALSVEMNFHTFDFAAPDGTTSWGGGVSWEAETARATVLRDGSIVQHLNDGTIPVFPRIVVGGPVPAGARLKCVDTGQAVVLVSALGNGESLWIDSRRRRVLKGTPTGFTPLRGAVDFAGTGWPVFPIGPNKLQAVGGGVWWITTADLS